MSTNGYDLARRLWGTQATPAPSAGTATAPSPPPAPAAPRATPAAPPAGGNAGADLARKLWPGGPAEPGLGGLESVEATPQYQKWAHPTPTIDGRPQAEYVNEAPQPVQDFLAHVGAVMEAPMTGFGAASMDATRGAHDPKYRPTAIAANNAIAAAIRGDPNWQKLVPKDSYLGQAVALMNAKQFQTAASLYSVTSAIANKKRAELGDPGAQYFVRHPGLFSLAAFGEEWLNPSVIASGEAFRGAAGLRGARGSGLNRMGPMRDAAERSADDRAAAAEAQARGAQQASRARQAAANQRGVDAYHREIWAKRNMAVQAQQQAARARAWMEGQPGPQPAIATGQAFRRALPPHAESLTIHRPTPAFEVPNLEAADVGAHPGPAGEAWRRAVQRALPPSQKEAAYRAALDQLAPGGEGPAFNATTALRNLDASGTRSYLADMAHDLRSRMYDFEHEGMFEKSYVARRTAELLGQLTDPNFASRLNGDTLDAAQLRGLSGQEQQAEQDAALQQYALAHAKVPTYNYVQKLAQNAAVAIGKQDWEFARAQLEELRSVLTGVNRQEPGRLGLTWEQYYNTFKPPGGQGVEFTPTQISRAPSLYDPGRQSYTVTFGMPSGPPEMPPGRLSRAAAVGYGYTPKYRIFESPSTHIDDPLYGQGYGERFYQAWRRFLEQEHPGIIGGETVYVNTRAAAQGAHALGRGYDPDEYMAWLGRGSNPADKPAPLSEAEITARVLARRGNIFRELTAPRVPTFAEQVEQRLDQAEQRLEQADLPRRRAFAQMLQTRAAEREAAGPAPRLARALARAAPTEGGPPIAAGTRGPNLPVPVTSRAIVPVEPPAAAEIPRDLPDAVDRRIRERILRGSTAQRANRDEVLRMWGGLTREQKWDLIDQIDGEQPMTPDTIRRFGPRAGLNRQNFGTALRLGLADVDALRNPEYYLTHQGATYDPFNESLEDAKARATQPWRPRGWTKGTLNQERKYQTVQEALRAGEIRNPEWDPDRVDEEQLNARSSLFLNESLLRDLHDWGLLTPKEIDGVRQPKPPGWQTLENHPDLRELASPTLRDSYFPPEIAQMVRDLSSPGSINPQSLLGGPQTSLIGRLFIKPLATFNYLASMLETRFSPYHLGVNVGPNQAAILTQAPNRLAAYATYLRELANPQGSRLAKASGLSQAFVSDVPAHRMTRPFSDLTLPEKLQRIVDAATVGQEKITSQPLYHYAEPHSTHAVYKGLIAGGVPENRAYLLARQAVGEPENMGPAWSGASQTFQFPRWRMAMGRLWPYLLGSAPGLYLGPQAAAQAWNVSRGAYQRETQQAPPSTGYAHLIPYFMTGRNKYGIPQYRSFPSPANLPLEAIDAAGNLIGGAAGMINPRAQFGDLRTGGGQLLNLALAVANPTLRQAARGGMTMVAEPGEPETGRGAFRLWDVDAGTRLAAQQALASIIGGYSPFRLDTNPATGRPTPQVPPGALGGLQAMFGVSQFGQEPQGAYKAHLRIEDAFRKGIHRLRAAAKTEANAGNPDLAQQYENEAQSYYLQMQAYLQASGLTPNLP